MAVIPWTLPRTVSEQGILRPRAGRFTLRRIAPAPELAHLVERHWVVAWDLRGEPDHTVELLPHPCANLVFQSGGAILTGVGTEKSRHPLSGAGQTFGTKLRPGAAPGLIGLPMSELTDRALPLSAIFGQPADQLAAAIGAADSDTARARLVEDFLRVRTPPHDPQAQTVGRIVHDMLHSDGTQRVEQVAAGAGWSTRTLQRLFRHYVGVSPKQVLVRYRLHEAADRLSDGDRPDWALLALELGYADQAHFIRDFHAAVGCTPAAYAAACATDLAQAEAG
ncbi:MAG: DUF6597 domain-containing transcriptional factor [Micromonosporaceae bacterium]